MPNAERLVLVGGDLMARSRLEDAARRAGLEFAHVAAHSPALDVAEDRSALIVVDLDSVGSEGLGALEGLGHGDELLRVIGYFSHVDAELGEAARRAGVETYPRGRFWRTLPDLIAGAAE